MLNWEQKMKKSENAESSHKNESSVITISSWRKFNTQSPFLGKISAINEKYQIFFEDNLRSFRHNKINWHIS